MSSAVVPEGTGEGDLEAAWQLYDRGVLGCNLRATARLPAIPGHSMHPGPILDIFLLLNGLLVRALNFCRERGPSAWGP